MLPALPLVVGLSPMAPMEAVDSDSDDELVENAVNTLAKCSHIPDAQLNALRETVSRQSTNVSITPNALHLSLTII